ncbi:hypothetical protein LMG29542_03417 [Paraburkholderia humisilvae]|uniref:Uncharacterized protein n=1 Tax=Paraburkholderia humisilvae TaxID=627669 RepID=A0A6J5E0G0_9BURK|nr:hypothetical protein LMG29542_03417 [Paraburkholderia humisilvae]
MFSGATWASYRHRVQAAASPPGSVARPVNGSVLARQRLLRSVGACVRINAFRDGKMGPLGTAWGAPRALFRARRAAPSQWIQRRGRPFSATAKCDEGRKSARRCPLCKPPTFPEHQSIIGATLTRRGLRVWLDSMENGDRRGRDQSTILPQPCKKTPAPRGPEAEFSQLLDRVLVGILSCTATKPAPDKAEGLFRLTE